jgi:hypothetical protein
MESGIISNNKGTNGGGVYILRPARYDDGNGINGGEISDNTATSKGGGIYTEFAGDTTVLAIRGGVIARNTAPVGGGVYVRSSFAFNLPQELNPQSGALTGSCNGTAIIYGSDGGANANEATNGTGKGHAVYAGNTSLNYRDTTANATTCLAAWRPYSGPPWMYFTQTGWVSAFTNGWESP